MEPSFKTGDLAIVKPAGQYRVRDIVAYHSSLLHIVVLHRIHAIHDGRYTFKGDNNSFLDPVHPTRSALIGKLWLHFPRGGVFLTALHTPITAGVLIGVVGLLLLRGLLRQARTPQSTQTSPLPSTGSTKQTGLDFSQSGSVATNAIPANDLTVCWAYRSSASEGRVTRTTT